MNTKSLQSNSHESKLIPDGRVTKIITHDDTLNSDILTHQEDDCTNQRIKIKLGQDKRSCCYNQELIRNPYTNKKLQCVLNKKV